MATENNYTVKEKEISAQIMKDFNMVEDQSLAEVATFLDENIDKVTRTDVDILLIRFIEMSEADVKNENSNSVGEKLLSILGLNYGPKALENGIE
ncbi:MAG: hypothetical protein WBA54_09760 [Acidaminobacteraceae bacterium]